MYKGVLKKKHLCGGKFACRRNTSTISLREVTHSPGDLKLFSACMLLFSSSNLPFIKLNTAKFVDKLKSTVLVLFEG